MESYPLHHQGHPSYHVFGVQFSRSVSVMSDFATPRTAACQASLFITSSRSLLTRMSIESVMPSNHFILCHPLFLLPSIFPRIMVFSNEYPSSYPFSSVQQILYLSLFSEAWWVSGEMEWKNNFLFIERKLPLLVYPLSLGTELGTFTLTLLFNHLI